MMGKRWGISLFTVVVVGEGGLEELEEQAEEEEEGINAGKFVLF